jgi:hypothetical protein
VTAALEDESPQKSVVNSLAAILIK